LAYHPSDEDLQAFLKGPFSRDPLLDRHVVRHLLSGCGPCDERLDCLDPSGLWRRQSPRFPGPDRNVAAHPGAEESDYDDILARAEQTFSLFFAAGRPVEEPPRSLLAKLAPATTPEEPGRWPTHDPRRAIPALTKWLIARSHAARYEDPKEMLHWGLMAHLAADSCSIQATAGKVRLADLRARAWSQFGNALRVCGRFREAGEVLATARDFLEAGTGDLQLRAHIYQQVASLYINQKFFGPATDLLEEAEAIYEGIQETHCLAASLLQRAVALQYANEPDQAISLIDRAMTLLDPIEDPDLLLVARLNRMRAFAANQPKRALSSFRATQSADWRGRPAMKLRASWLGGQLLSEIGYLEAADAALCSARSGFIGRDLAPEVVAVSSDLAGVYRKMGKSSELEQLVLETQALFFGIPAEAEVLKSLQELERMAFV
jgi:tetratricopeptide (TPR) repeat protein